MPFLYLTSQPRRASWEQHISINSGSTEYIEGIAQHSWLLSAGRRVEFMQQIIQKNCLPDSHYELYRAEELIHQIQLTSCYKTLLGCKH